MESEIEKAVKVLTKALVADEDYRRTWSANIAMAFIDEFDKEHKHSGVHNISNQAAENFLALLCRDVEKL